MNGLSSQATGPCAPVTKLPEWCLQPLGATPLTTLFDATHVNTPEERAELQVTIFHVAACCLFNLLRIAIEGAHTGFHPDLCSQGINKVGYSQQLATSKYFKGLESRSMDLLLHSGNKLGKDLAAGAVSRSSNTKAKVGGHKPRICKPPMQPNGMTMQNCISLSGRWSTRTCRTQCGESTGVCVQWLAAPQEC